MSASARAADVCNGCGATLAPDARYCPHCGLPAGAPAGATQRVELPADETGPVPISISRVEPHWFGVTPPLFSLVLSLGAIVVALVFLARGRWPVGLILLGIGALLLALYLESARRRRSSVIARVSADVRDRAGSTLESLRARSLAVAETRRVHSELNVLRTQRRDALLALGEATHRDDKKAAKALRERLDELEVEERTLRSRLESRLAEAGERIRRARLAVDETMMVAPAYPPPDEGDPPTPAPVPEPYPPDEIEPPQPNPPPDK